MTAWHHTADDRADMADARYHEVGDDLGDCSTWSAVEHDAWLRSEWEAGRDADGPQRGDIESGEQVIVHASSGAVIAQGVFVAATEVGSPAEPMVRLRVDDNLVGVVTMAVERARWDARYHEGAGSVYPCWVVPMAGA